jgi:DNA-binding transcriptional LysR family regulator
VARPLGESRSYLVASPEFIAKHGHPTQPADLSRLASVGKSRHDAAYNWRLTDSDGQTRTIPYQPVLETDDWLLLKQAVVAGVGIASIPAELCQRDVAAGRLEIILPAWKLPSATLYIVYASRRGLITAVRFFIDFAAERLAAIFSGTIFDTQ